MSIKGQAKIQIFDQDGSLKNEIVEDNIITNAVANILSLRGREYFTGHRGSLYNHMNYHLAQATPISTELLGGILLFENQIEANANTIIPPVGSVPVGHAGRSYAGNNPNRGTYNSNESGALYEGQRVVGYRHVWDFGTDKCNGSIGCICLTSALGGNTGWKSQSQSSAGSNSSLFDQDASVDSYLTGGGGTASRPFSTFIVNKGFQIFSPVLRGIRVDQGKLFYFDEENGDFYFAERYLNADNQFAVYKGSLPKEISVGLNDVVSDMTGVVPTKLFTINNSYLSGRHAVWFDNAAENVNVLFVSSETQMTHSVYSLAGAVVSTKTITLATGMKFHSWSYPTVNPVLYKSYYYAIIQGATSQDMVLAKIDENGSVITTFPWYSTTDTRYGTAQYFADVVRGIDRVIFKKAPTYVSNDGVEIIFDGSTLETFKNCDSTGYNERYVDCSNNVLPGFYMVLNSSNGSAVILYYKFFSTYLGSINNLANPVVKTSADTMKIIYDLYTE